MTIVVTGGGSGGHITPILAVASELKQLDASIRIVYIGQRGDKLADLPAADPHIDAVYTVYAGKFRRYHGEGWRQLLDLPTVFKNFRDLFLIFAGLIQSYFLLRKIRPTIIFTRGGFVSVPVAIGGKLNGISYITHDSDAIPSLANRLIARWASLHAVALPEEIYPYPIDKTVMVGVPINKKYQVVTNEAQRAYRKELGLAGYNQVILVTGGGNGAAILNDIMVANCLALLRVRPQLVLLHITGRALQAKTEQAYAAVLTPELMKQVRVEGFVDNLYAYSGAADVIVARGGATNLAEFAVQRKTCIVVPTTTGQPWANKNTDELVKRNAIIKLTETQLEQEGRLAAVLSELLDNSSKRSELESAIGMLAQPNAGLAIAKILVKEGQT
jgi:UDP-N-acetylglucosamine--N-acetylmuramyl-(pentapeptide) pyrophosphoryl-undecaprenol N-acetylglucosamine transferase